MARIFSIFYERFKIEIAFIILIFVEILTILYCLNHIETIVLKYQEPDQLKAPSRSLSSACIEVEGTVPGDIIPGSIVFLFETSSEKFSVVMNRIRARQPVSQGTVNASGRFSFVCLSPGKYAFVIPSASFDGAIGFPLPYEFDCKNLSLEIAFQGGDYQYAVGAFSIEDSITGNSLCSETIGLCRTRRGVLYKECPSE